MLKTNLQRILIEQRKLVTNQLISYIRKTEIEKEFPFNLLNDLRGYINYAPYYFESFAKLIFALENYKIKKEKLIKFFGNPTRMRRYIFLLVIGAYLDNHYKFEEKLYVLEEVANLMNKNLHYFYSRTKESAVNLIKLIPLDKNLSSLQKLSTSRLFIIVREFTDFIFLGEHPIGYQPFPPQKVGKYDVIVRSFFNLKYDGYFNLFDEVNVVDLYLHGNYKFSYDLFSGIILNIPMYKEKELSAFTLNQKLQKFSLIPIITEAFFDGFNRRKEHYRKFSRIELELEKMIIYSFELNKLYKLINDTYIFPNEAKESVLKNSIAKVYKKKSNSIYYTDVYFDLLRNSIDFLLFKKKRKLINVE